MIPILHFHLLKNLIQLRHVASNGPPGEILTICDLAEYQRCSAPNIADKLLISLIFSALEAEAGSQFTPLTF
jgi:hypothetical protein